MNKKEQNLQMERGNKDMAKYIILVGPAYGHVNPTLAIAQELVRRGEQVVYYLTEEFRASVESQKTLSLEPLAKALNPVITWQSLLFHPEAMTTLSIDVQFDRVTGISPRGIERQTCSRSHRVIVGGQQKQRRSISWYSDTPPEKAG
jgi:hypothetical protein